ncbi:MAG TPA: hypothetical protein VGO68_10290 [Pyrinomonadaceae bacterium]|jgi:hypothetical protein|nr:hypothetical protein [Pyrinomonadaceae bacterium]
MFHKGVFSKSGALLAFVLLLLVTSPTSAQTLPTSPNLPTAASEKIEPLANAPGGTTAVDSEAKSKPLATAEPKADSAEALAVKAAPEPIAAAKPLPPAQCKRMISADVVAFPQPIMLNRLGAAIPDGLIFALRSDTVGTPGQLSLRPGKRPRPLVLRANVGDCLTIAFQNSIPLATFGTTQLPGAATGTSEVSLHVQGMEWVAGTQDDGSFVGKNNSSLATADPVPANMPPHNQTYTLFAKEEGTFLLYTMGDTSSNGDQLIRGLFGSLNVQPAAAEWYRSQVTADDLAKATYNANSLPAGATLSAGPCTSAAPCTFTAAGKPPVQAIKTANGSLNTLDNHPIVNYNAMAGTTPILKMLNANNQIVYSDLTAIITGPNAGRFSGTTGPNNPEPPCNAEDDPALNSPSGKPDPLFCGNPASPDRKQPYREITTIYHGALIPVVAQAFPVFSDANMKGVLQAGDDAFAINYGTGGIGAEVYGNRIGVGPMGDCVDCKFEEFFLSAWSVGDPAMLVDKPANSNLAAPCTTTVAFNTPPCGGQKSSNTFPYTMHPTMKATAAFFPDDPSNVYHSYINDHVKFRILHGGRDVSHVHHQHAHQWLQSPNSDEGSYLDSQMISPGASYTLEMVYNGSGNRNKVVGDSIFHCHFYPHFAAGMWAMWRTHDTFEAGTFVYPAGNPKAGQVVPGARALPDGEIVGGSPTPAIVPLPTLPMAPLPAYAQIQNNVIVNGAQTTFGGQVVVGGACAAGKINGLDVIGGVCPVLPPGTNVNGTVINSQFNGSVMTGQFVPSAANQILNPGYPYFIPGIAGARAPHPPFDFAPDAANPGSFLDGGLPRHIVTGGSVSYESHDQFDWSKDFEKISAVGLPETGTDVEKAAINFFSVRCHQTFLPDGSPSNCAQPTPFGFILNGLPLGPQSGAPFADPAVDDLGNAVGLKRTYKAAAIQLDVAFNKKRWHYPQQRILTLWKDVQPTFAFSPTGTGGRPPEPLFFRGNTGDIIEYWHTNLVPNYYLVDDFQVRTPTDILGQHIHLVKFDVTSSDGAGNGFNYEDGTFSPEEVQDLIRAINLDGGLTVAGVKQPLAPAKKPPADIIACPNGSTDPRCKLCPNNWTPTFRPQCLSWMGAQTTIQRWYLDPLLDDAGVDRTLRTVFTHDHFGPSTHQQIGLYAGLLVEPVGSAWRNSETGSTMGTVASLPPIRSDGGPTSWKVDVIAKDKNNNDISYREFALEFQDLQLAYAWASIGTTAPLRTQPDPNPKKGYMDPAYAINAPSQSPTVSSPDLISTGTANTPPGTQTVNYRNDPIAWRVGPANDMSYAYDSALKQASNAAPNGDPSTPLLRTYQNDNTQVRVLVGAHVFSHQFNLEGPTWFSEPSWKNSGYRSTQAMGLSEHFEMLFKVPSSSAPNIARKCPDGLSQANCVDYFYSPSKDEFGISNGMWGLFRAYDPTKIAKTSSGTTTLQPLPNNPIGAGTNVSYATCPAVLPAPAVKRVFNITAVTAQKALVNISPVPADPTRGQILLNSRGQTLRMENGVLYVRTEDLDPQGRLKVGTPVEPLILRANAGDCIEINLTNALDPNAQVFKDPLFMAPPFNGVSPVPPHAPLFASKMSGKVGLHPQLLSYDSARSNGTNIGWNRQGQPDQIAGFGQTIQYQWYAGKIDRTPAGTLSYMPVEFGSLNLNPSDPLYQSINGLFGQMVIEPAGSTWTCDPGNTPCDPGGAIPQTRASATVKLPDNTMFREFSLMINDDLLVSSQNSGAVNYRTEPFVFRYTGNATTDFSCMTSNQLIGGQDPQTPIFTAGVGDRVRFRMTHPFGMGNSQVFSLHGHVWQRNPYIKNSTEMGKQALSQWIGSRDNHGSTDHFDMMIDKAGGEGGQAGDYLYTVYVPIQAKTGAWGIFRVGTNNAAVQPNAKCVLVPAPPAAVTPAAAPKDDDLERFNRLPNNKNPKP